MGRVDAPPEQREPVGRLPGVPDPMRPRTASRRINRRLAVTVLAVAAVSIACTVGIALVRTMEQVLVVVSLWGIAVVGALAWQRRGDGRDRRRVDVYYARVLDLDDDPETDPRTDV